MTEAGGIPAAPTTPIAVVGMDCAFPGAPDLDGGRPEVSDERRFARCSWRAMEDAGHPPFTFPGRVGVFVGESASVARESFRGDLAEPSDEDPLARALGLTGPVVRTACSLAAVRLACDAL
ncbi:MAG: hypothetical protein HOV94_11285, partial [Saccharothrix sp.]|nr:hypothetical protein [Saccharothrix sp.]